MPVSIFPAADLIDDQPPRNCCADHSPICKKPLVSPGSAVEFSLLMRCQQITHFLHFLTSTTMGWACDHREPLAIRFGRRPAQPPATLPPGSSDRLQLSADRPVIQRNCTRPFLPQMASTSRTTLWPAWTPLGTSPVLVIGPARWRLVNLLGSTTLIPRTVYVFACVQPRSALSKHYCPSPDISNWRRHSENPAAKTGPPKKNGAKRQGRKSQDRAKNPKKNPPVSTDGPRTGGRGLAARKL